MNLYQKTVMDQVSDVALLNVMYIGKNVLSFDHSREYHTAFNTDG